MDMVLFFRRDIVGSALGHISRNERSDKCSCNSIYILDMGQNAQHRQKSSALCCSCRDCSTQPAASRTYNIFDAVEKFIPDKYEVCDSADRLTYTGGSTSAGAVVYNDIFVFSHHATDPAGGKLCNAFDLVRLHLFSDLDADSKDNTPVNKLPSFVKMGEFARSLEAADKVYLNPEGDLEFNGLSVEVSFFKKLFDKLEIKPQIFRVGDFKSAVEPFMLDHMSAENKLQLNELI